MHGAQARREARPGAAWRRRTPSRPSSSASAPSEETDGGARAAPGQAAPAQAARAAWSASTSRTSRARASSPRRWPSPTARPTSRATAASGSRRVEQQDDFASMHEVLTRRLKRGLEEEDLPDLIVIDGGKGQLASAHAAMKDLGVEGVDVSACQEPRPGGASTATPRAPASPERVFLPRPQGSDRPAAELGRAVHAHPAAGRGPPLRDHLPAEADAQEAASTPRWRTFPGWAKARKKALLRHFGCSSGFARRPSRSWPKWSGPRWPSGSMPPSTATGGGRGGSHPRSVAGGCGSPGRRKRRRRVASRLGVINFRSERGAEKSLNREVPGVFHCDWPRR